MAETKNTTVKSYTPSELYGINMGLGFLVAIDVEKIGVEMLWDAVDACSTIKPTIESINKIAEKINKEFHTDTSEDGTPKVPEDKLEAFKAANEEFDAMQFKVKLPKFDKKKLQKLPGFTGRHALQLLPLLS